MRMFVIGILAGATLACRSGVPLIFVPGPMAGFEKAQTIALGAGNPNEEYFYGRLRREFAPVFAQSCLRHLRFVEDPTESDVILRFAEHPICPGAHIPCTEPTDATVLLNFKVGGEAVLHYTRSPLCTQRSCFYSGAARQLAKDWCAYIP